MLLRIKFCLFVYRTHKLMLYAENNQNLNIGILVDVSDYIQTRVYKFYFKCHI